MPKEIANKIEKKVYVKCKKCNTEVLSITHGSLNPSKCGAISVDGSKEIVGVIG